MAYDPAYIVDINGVECPIQDQGITGKGRPWIGILFDCCGLYTRVYRNEEGTAYLGRCPKCMRSIRLRVGPDGTDARFFIAE